MHEPPGQQEAAISLLLFNRVLDNFLLQSAGDARLEKQLVDSQGLPINFCFFILTVVGLHLNDEPHFLNQAHVGFGGVWLQHKEPLNPPHFQVRW